MRGLMIFGFVGVPLFFILGILNLVFGWAGGTGWTVFFFLFSLYILLSLWIAIWRENRLEQQHHG
jgi:hypothetical protein